MCCVVLSSLKRVVGSSVGKCTCTHGSKRELRDRKSPPNRSLDLLSTLSLSPATGRSPSMASLYVPCACLGVMQGPPLSATLAAAQQHPLDAQSLESALRNIHMIEESLKSVLPALHARRRSEEQPVPEAYDLDAELLAETEAEEARAERELISIRRRAEALGSLRHRRRFVTAGLEERASPVVSMQTVAAPQVGAADAAGIAPGVGSSEAAMVLAARASAAGEAAMAAAAMAAAMADRRPPTPPPLQRAPLQQPPLHLQQPPLQQPPLQQPPLQQPPLQQAPLQQPPLQQPQAQAQTKPAAQQPDSLSSPLGNSVPTSGPPTPHIAAPSPSPYPLQQARWLPSANDTRRGGPDVGASSRVAETATSDSSTASPDGGRAGTASTKPSVFTSPLAALQQLAPVPASAALNRAPDPASDPPGTSRRPHIVRASVAWHSAARYSLLAYSILFVISLTLAAAHCVLLLWRCARRGSAAKDWDGDADNTNGAAAAAFPEAPMPVPIQASVCEADEDCVAVVGGVRVGEPVPPQRSSHSGGALRGASDSDARQADAENDEERDYGLARSTHHEMQHTPLQPPPPPPPPQQVQPPPPQHQHQHQHPQHCYDMPPYPANPQEAPQAQLAQAQQAAQQQAQQFHEVEGLLRSGKPALSVSESKRVADFLARQKDVMILCGRPAK